MLQEALYFVKICLHYIYSMVNTTIIYLFILYFQGIKRAEISNAIDVYVNGTVGQVMILKFPPLKLSVQISS